MIKRKPTHPGEVLLEDVIKPLGLTITEASRSLGVTRKTLSELVNGRSSLSPEMAVRVATATNTSPESWVAMQTKLDIWHAQKAKLKGVRPFPQRAAGGGVAASRGSHGRARPAAKRSRQLPKTQAG